MAIMAAATLLLPLRQRLGYTAARCSVAAGGAVTRATTITAAAVASTSRRAAHTGVAASASSTASSASSASVAATRHLPVVRVGSGDAYRARVFAAHLAVSHKLNLGRVMHGVLCADEEEQALRASRWYGSLDRDTALFSLRPSGEGAPERRERVVPSHVAVTRRGVVVFVNTDISDAVYFLEVLRSVVATEGMLLDAPPGPSPHYTAEAATTTGAAVLGLPADAGAPIPGGYVSRAREFTTLLVQPRQAAWVAQVAPGLVAVKKLDLDTVRVLTHALSSSVVLQRHEQRVAHLFRAVE